MTKKELERARHLFSLIGWWSQQMEGEGAFETVCKDRIFESAREGYYLLGEVQDPFPGEKEAKDPTIWIRRGITIAAWGSLLALVGAKCAGWI